MKETSQAIVGDYSPEVFALHTTTDEWRLIAQRFGSKWNFYHCPSDLDMNHIATKTPYISGSVYYNYKRVFSIIVLTLVDADYCFTWVDIDANGSTSDFAVYNISELQDNLEHDRLNISPPESLPGNVRYMVYFIFN